MKYKVIKRFQDKITKAIFPVNSTYQTDDEERAKFLQDNGFLYVEKQEDSPYGAKRSILDESVEEIKKNVTAELGKDKLEVLLELEKEAKNRKGVVEHIEELLQEVE